MQQSGEQYRQIRIAKLGQIKKSGVNPFPARCLRDETIAQSLVMEGSEVKVAGRLRAMRGHGKLQFADIHDFSGKIQVVFKADVLAKDKFEILKLLDIGDFIAVQGEVFKTHAGEISVLVKEYQIIVKSLRPLPEKWHGISDVEERYRHRYLDIIFNPQVKEKILLRTKVIKALRNFLDKNDFIEVETPILETNASGALAKPFKTHIHAYDIDLYLRICIGELWQKRLMVAGFEKTYEIGRAFRNEGVSHEHNPEFSMLEYYWAYADFIKNMEFQEQLFAETIKDVTGNNVIEFEGKKIDFTPPFKRKKYFELIKEKTGLDIPHMERSEFTKTVKSRFAEKKKKIDEKLGFGKLVDEFYKEFVRPTITGPLFLTHHPVELKPLAKLDEKDKSVVESFQLIVCGMELSNNYSELNDPIVQAENFTDQEKMKAKGDEETMAQDDDFVQALEYGMPPTSGTGIGIDRLVSLLTNSHSLREIIIFPLMRPKNIL